MPSGSASTAISVALDFGPPLAADESARLWFRGVPHAAASYAVRVFLAPVSVASSTEDPAFAGSFAVYGHGRSVDLPVHPDPDGAPGFGGLRPFDTVVDISRAARALAVAGRLELTLVSVPTRESDQAPPLRFARLELQRRAR